MLKLIQNTLVVNVGIDYPYKGHDDYGIGYVTSTILLSKAKLSLHATIFNYRRVFISTNIRPLKLMLFLKFEVIFNNIAAKGLLSYCKCSINVPNFHSQSDEANLEWYPNKRPQKARNSKRKPFKEKKKDLKL